MCNSDAFCGPSLKTNSVVFVCLFYTTAVCHLDQACWFVLCISSQVTVLLKNLLNSPACDQEVSWYIILIYSYSWYLLRPCFLSIHITMLISVLLPYHDMHWCRKGNEEEQKAFSAGRNNTEREARKWSSCAGSSYCIVLC